MGSKYINIRVDYENGEARLVPTRLFYQMTDIWQLDILQDINNQSADLYRDLLDNFYSDFEPDKPDEMRDGGFSLLPLRGGEGDSELGRRPPPTLPLINNEDDGED